MTLRSTLKQWFSRGKKPTAAQFSEWIDSFWHKSEDTIEISDIHSLPQALNEKSDVGHTHDASDIQNLPVINVDAAIDPASTNPVENKAVAEALNEKANTTHSHGMSDITNLTQTINGKSDVGHNHNDQYQPLGDYAPLVHEHSQYAPNSSVQNLQEQIDLLAQGGADKKEVIAVSTYSDLVAISEPSQEVIYKTLDTNKLYLYNGRAFEDVTGVSINNTIYVSDIAELLASEHEQGLYSVYVVTTTGNTTTVSATYSFAVTSVTRFLQNKDGWAERVTVGNSYQWSWHNYAYNGHTHSQYLTQHQDISGKADKVSGATAGNFAALDANGNPTDSGKKAADFATAAQGAKADTALQSHQDISGKQDKTDNTLLTTAKTIIGAINELWTKFKDYLKGIQHVTHAELVALRDNGELVPGQRYRITDYTCTTKQPETHSAGHVFDIIVTADDVSTLNENARAVKHTGDTYFSGSKLSTWKLKYCLDNDITRFAWADTESGKGVIYYLEDEFGNLAEYDFKNVQFKRYRATIKEEYEGILGSSKFMLLQDNDEGWYDINDSVFELDTDDYIWCYTFHDIVNGNKDGSLNHFDGEAYNPRGVFKNSIPCNRISVSYDEVLYTSLYLSNIVHYVTLPTGDDYDTEGIWTCGNEFGIECQNLTFSKKCRNSKFIGSIRNTTFGGNINRATFGGYIGNTTFGGDIGNTTFGGYIDGATFGGYIENTTFGGNINRATFGGDIWDTTFGGYIYGATFGGNIGYTTFGGYILGTTFGGGIDGATFGGEIRNTTFGGNLYNGHIHGRLYSVSIGSAGETWSNLVIDPGVEYVSVTCTESGDADIKNVHIFGGVSGTDDNQITVSIPTRNNALLEIKPTTKTEILV